MDTALFDKLVGKAKAMPNGCVVWMAGRNAQGYGQCYHNGHARAAHRLMYVAINGAIPDGLMVLHSCDNPPCLNPSHLSLGTTTDNIRECRDRGRHFWARKTHCPQGHEYAGDNLYICKEGRRHCNMCCRIRFRMRAGWPEAIARTAPIGVVGYVPQGLIRVPPPPTRKPKSSHCRKGHALTGANVYLNTRGYVNCQQCQRDARTRYAQRIRAQQDYVVDGSEKS